MTSNSTYYCSPGKAAELTGDTLEHVIQRARWGPGKPGRLPLYALLKTSREVLWFVIPSEKDPNYSGPEDGEADLYQGGHLEIDHSESALLAASPEETFLVRTLRAPAEGLGITKRIPGRALLYIRNEAQGISVNFSQCLIAERDLFGAEFQPKPKPQRRENQINAMVKTAKAMGFDPLKIPFGGKQLLLDECLKRHPQLFVSMNAADKTWKAGTAKGLLKSAVEGGHKG